VENQYTSVRVRNFLFFVQIVNPRSGFSILCSSETVAQQNPGPEVYWLFDGIHDDDTDIETQRVKDQAGADALLDFEKK
jgi:hypothetical protein